MTGWFIAMMWAGGVPPSYKGYRKTGGRLYSLVQAVGWPMDLGYYIVKNYAPPVD